VINVDALESAHRQARVKSEREHVTPFIWKHPDLFRLGNHMALGDHSSLRWIVDDARDLEFVRTIFRGLYAQDPVFRMKDVLKLLAAQPDIAKINSGTQRNEGYDKSLGEDQAVGR
jgi:spore coat polysaccharide biosynthesis protein SpsF (cytidylyltransferase family)